MKYATSGLAFALALAGCTPAPMPSPAAGAAPAQDAAAPSDMAVQSPPPAALPPPGLDQADALAGGWVGTWRGPEGTSLEISRSPEGFEVVITNLDGPRRFRALAAREGLQFERDAATETLKPGDGQATGMKWLADKKDCLVVKAGEGYCRD